MSEEHLKMWSVDAAIITFYGERSYVGSVFVGGDAVFFANLGESPDSAMAAVLKSAIAELGTPSSVLMDFGEAPKTKHVCEQFGIRLYQSSDIFLGGR